jgi:hypothetical protein
MSVRSPFASFVTKTVPVPGHAPHTVTLRKLGWKAKSKARQARALTRMQAAKNLGEMLEVLAKAEEIDTKRKAEAAAAAMGQPAVAAELGAEPTAPPSTPDSEKTLARAKRREQYDEHEVLVGGVVSWTFEEMKPSAAALDDLDDDLKTFFVDEILELGEAEGPDAQKND